MRKKSDFAIFLITLLFACLCAGPVRAQDTGPAGSSQPMDIRKPILTLNYFICTNGNFPFHDQTGLGAVDLTAPFLGQICIGAFPSTNLPPGFALCQGQSLAISQNAPLFSILTTAFGGNGSTTFNLPDL